MQKVEVKIIEPAPDGFGNRVETGVVEFVYPEEIDWPGVFIRGDNALMLYAPALEHILSKIKITSDDGVLGPIYMETCKALVELLKECKK